MADNSYISPDDADLLLARKIGEALPDLSSLKKDADPFLIELFKYRNTIKKHVPEIDSASIWDSIQSEIEQEKDTARIVKLTPAIKRYAIAAALLITALVGSFVYQSLTSPTLIGESFASIQQIQLQDGSTVSLRPNSRLYENSVSPNSAEYRIEGEGYFEVAHNPDRTFTVVTDQAKVEVLGTQFVLSSWGNSSKVFLQEGKIKYESLKNSESVILEPGQSSIVNDATDSPLITQSEESVYTDWLTNELVFQNELVSDVFNELEQHFNIQIESPESVLDETLSGSIQLDEISSVLHDLELVLGGSFTHTGDSTYVFNPGN